MKKQELENMKRMVRSCKLSKLHEVDYHAKNNPELNKVFKKVVAETWEGVLFTLKYARKHKRSTNELSQDLLNLGYFLH